MKKTVLIAISTLISVGAFAGWIDLPENAGNKLFDHTSNGNETTIVQFSLDGFEMEPVVETGTEYQKISYFNEGHFVDFGKPELPRFTRLVAIPQEGDVSVMINNLEEEIISDIIVYPAQSFQSESQPVRNEFIKDEAFYSGSEVFPLQMVEIGEPAFMRDLRVVNVTVNPFQYNPQTRELKIIKNIEFTVNAQGRGSGITKENRKLSRAFESLYRATVLNYDSVISRDEEYQKPTYLFIFVDDSSNNVTNNLPYITDWKRQKGFEVYIQEYTSGTSFYTIKAFVQNAYDTWEDKPEFICLVGDAEGTYNIPTDPAGGGDHGYVRLDGTDILADAFVGRLSFNTIIELQTIISKILNYEKTPYMAQTNWYNRALLVGDPGSSGMSCVFTNQSIKEMIDYYTPNIISTEVYSGSFSYLMSSNLNSGVSYFNFRGWMNMAGFDNISINNLTNGLMLPFAVFLTCATGNFVGATSRSEAFIRAGSPSNQKGAIAAIGTATTSTHTGFNNCVDLGIFYGIFTDKIYHPGGALNRGKLNLYLNYPQNPSNCQFNFSYWNNLMGDPGIEFWTGIPEEMDVVYDSQIGLGTNYFEVTVENSSGNPVENAWISLLTDDNQLFSGYTNEDGYLYLELDIESTGIATMTVTCHDFIPHLENVEIVVLDKFVNVSEIQIDDDNNGSSSGNTNGLVNPGESIELNVGLENYGLQTANNVTATISTSNDFITITDDIEEFGNISPGSIAFSADDFDFTVDEDVLGGTEILLNIAITDDESNQWNDLIIIPVDGPHLSVDEYILVNDPNSNGIFDPGETVELQISLFNGGTVIAMGIEGQLSCSNSYITFVDSLGVFETIPPGMTGTNSSNTFEVTADIAILPGSQIAFNLLLTNTSGYDHELTFFINIGEVTVTDPLGPDEYGYYCYDSYDTGYEGTPVYNWIEIDPSFGGSGTTLGLYDPGNTGAIQIITVPFNFNFYGINYNSLTVCSNGWVAPGGTTMSSFMNWQVPGPGGPSPMIAPFWDDLKTGSGHVCYYHDTNINAFIVEWSHLQNEYNSAEETFQMLLLDPAYYPSPTGDVEIIFQYETINNVDQGSYPSQHGQYATVGLEDHTGTIGLEYTFNNTYPTAARILQNGLALKLTTLGSGMMDPPIIGLNQEEFQFVLLENETDSQTLQITNSGEANLVFNITKQYIDERGQGGPDAYGYQWIDSNEPNGPVYEWRDISGLGTPVTFVHNDEATPLMPIGFDFNFYGTYYSEFRINPNGWIGFGDDCTEWNNLSLPHPDAPKPAIMPFWDDLDPLQGGDVYYYSTSDSLVVWFDNVIHFPGNYTGTYNFQLIIYPSGSFLFQYQSVSGDIDSATIGIQDENASTFLQIVYNGPYVQNELAVYFKKIVDWVDVTPNMGYVEAGETESVTITVTSEELILGDYLCNLKMTTNDPEASLITIPVNLSVVSDYPRINLSSDFFDFNTVFIGEEVVDTLIVYNIGTLILVVDDITNELDVFTATPTNFVVDPDEQRAVIITFAPTSEMVYNDTLKIYSNDPIDPIKNVVLTGEGIFEVNSENELPLITKIYQNYPNPFNPETTIRFSLSQPGKVKIEIFNIKGEKVKTLVDQYLEVKNYAMVWDGKDENRKSVASGVYFYKFQTGKHLDTKKMLLIK